MIGRSSDGSDPSQNTRLLTKPTQNRYSSKFKTGASFSRELQCPHKLGEFGEQANSRSPKTPPVMGPTAQHPAMPPVCMEETDRPASPPAHAIITLASQLAQHRGQPPPRHVPGPRRVLTLRATPSASSAHPCPAARAFFGNHALPREPSSACPAELCFFAERTAPGAVNAFSCGASALVTGDVPKSTSLLAAWPGRRPATKAVVGSLHGAASAFKRVHSSEFKRARSDLASQRTSTAGARKPWPSSLVE